MVFPTVDAVQLNSLPLDRRAALRFAIGEQTSDHLIAAVGESFWPARVRDLSTRGVNLHLRRRFEPGSSVLLELANGVRVFSLAMMVRVVRLEEQPDGSFLLGGEFSRKLTYNELMALLS
jgi:hypothetical protein